MPDKRADSIERRRASLEAIYHAITAREAEIAKAVPQTFKTYLTPERVIRVAWTTIQNPSSPLSQCEPTSIVRSIIEACQLGLEVGSPTGHAYLVPHYNSKSSRYQCQLMIGYQGKIEIALRSGKVDSLIARAVRENDEFSVSFGDEECIIHRPAVATPRGELTHAYAIATLASGRKLRWVSDREQIEKRRAMSQSWRNEKARPYSPWSTWPEEMWVKTAVHGLWKYLPKSADMVAAQEHEADQEREYPVVDRPEQLAGADPKTLGELSVVLDDAPEPGVEAVSDDDKKRTTASKQKEELPF